MDLVGHAWTSAISRCAGIYDTLLFLEINSLDLFQWRIHILVCDCARIEGWR